MNSRFALPGAATLKPPNGGVSFCRPSSADLRSTGSFASAARLVIAFGSIAGEMLRPAGRGHRGDRAIGERSRRGGAKQSRCLIVAARSDRAVFEMTSSPAA